MKEKMRKTGIKIIGDAPWGTHFCLFYQTKQDLIDILVPYFKAGLENNEFCLWITSGPLSEKEAKKAIKKAVPHFDRYLKRGQIEIIPHTRWYLKAGSFNPKRLLYAWADKCNQAISKGYDGIRGAGSAAWLEKRDWRNFTDYEEKVNNLIGKFWIIALCTYPLDKCGAAEIIDVVSHHGFALIKRQGGWELVESSERKRAVEELKKAKASVERKVKEATRQLKKQHQAQQNFFINLAHELKTPLTIMKGSLDLGLGKGREKIRKNPKNFGRFVITQKEEVNRMEKIINDLSTLAKAETKQLVLRFQKIKLHKLIEKVCLRLKAVAEQEKKELFFKNLMPLTIGGDQEGLEQLMSNLLDNAIKFSKPKSGQIQVCLTKSGGRAKIRVKDNGIGIPKKDQPFIFERFFRGTNVKCQPKLRGSGLGLAICAWIVKEHQGEITVKSGKDGGVVFTVFLPLTHH